MSQPWAARTAVPAFSRARSSAPLPGAEQAPDSGPNARLGAGNEPGEAVLRSESGGRDTGRVGIHVGGKRR